MIQISDMHGWIGGHRHESSYGDMATYQSYVDQVQLNISKAVNASLMFVDGGDACEGTGFSDATDPRCSLVLQGLSNLSIDVTTIGNHDLGDAGTVNYFLENKEALFGDRFVTTNTYFNDVPMGNEYKYQVLDNGLRVLVFGFLYMANNDYHGAEVRNQTEVIRSESVQKIINEYGKKTDLVVLDLHIATHDQEANETQFEIRRQFKEKFNYSVPIAVMTAHTH